MQLCELSWTQTYFELVHKLRVMVYECALSRSIYLLGNAHVKLKWCPQLRLWALPLIESAMVEVTLVENCDIMDLRYKMEWIYVSTSRVLRLPRR